MLTTLKNPSVTKWTWSGTGFVRESPGEKQFAAPNRRQVYKRARYYDPQTGEFISRDPLEYVDGMSLYRAYFVLGKVDPFGQEKFDPDWLGSSGCFDACQNAGNSYASCIYYCNFNSLPDDWPDKIKRPTLMICWGEESEFNGVWPLPKVDFDDKKGGCICQLPLCHLERPRGVDDAGNPGPVSTPGRGDAPCKIGQKRVMKFKGKCVKNRVVKKDCECDKDWGGCEVFAVYECTNNKGINNWSRIHMKGTKCE